MSIPGPPGQEQAVRTALETQVSRLGLRFSVDAKGNLVVPLGTGAKPRVVVTAHMDEVAMIVRTIEADGRIRVSAMGALYPWKLGEGPVDVLAPSGPIEGVQSFGSIHTESPESAVVRAREGPLDWSLAHVSTGLQASDLAAKGVRPGTRVVVAAARRGLTRAGDLVAGYFLDNRAELVSWVLALEALKSSGIEATFVATVSEELGGHGALYHLHEHRPEVCIALELGPHVPDARVALNGHPSVWASDSYSAMQAADLDLVAQVGAELGLQLQFQVLSRGGSDASCAASHGLCARPFTLGIPIENSHGYEIMHPDGMRNLANLASALVARLAAL